MLREAQTEWHALVDDCAALRSHCATLECVRKTAIIYRCAYSIMPKEKTRNGSGLSDKCHEAAE